MQSDDKQEPRLVTRGESTTDATAHIDWFACTFIRDANLVDIVESVFLLPQDDWKRRNRGWQWLDKLPKFRMLKEPQGRVRFLTREEAARLLAELPGHLQAMARFALATGLRQSNVTGLRWSRVDLDRGVTWVDAVEAKGRRAIPVPLNAEAMQVIQRQLGKHPEWVFPYKGNRVKWITQDAWHNALKRAGIEDFRWHDLRHTWASWHAQDGTPMHVLQTLGGWQTPAMVQRYLFRF